METIKNRLLKAHSVPRSHRFPLTDNHNRVKLCKYYYNQYYKQNIAYNRNNIIESVKCPVSSLRPDNHIVIINRS